jgi:hypothetical protein
VSEVAHHEEDDDNDNVAWGGGAGPITRACCHTSFMLVREVAACQERSCMPQPLLALVPPPYRCWV